MDILMWYGLISEPYLPSWNPTFRCGSADAAGSWWWVWRAKCQAQSPETPAGFVSWDDPNFWVTISSVKLPLFNHVVASLFWNFRSGKTCKVGINMDENEVFKITSYIWWELEVWGLTSVWIGEYWSQKSKQWNISSLPAGCWGTTTGRALAPFRQERGAPFKTCRWKKKNSCRPCQGVVSEGCWFFNMRPL